MSLEECKEVADILDMHRAFAHSAQSVGVDAQVVRFRGFDGNDESKQLAYTTFLLRRENKWQELQNKGHNYNSHARMLPRYRAMLGEWGAIEDRARFELTKEQIERIMSEG